MFTFAKTISKLLNDYKAIIKKHLTRSEWVTKVNELGLKRKILKHDDEVALYQKAHRVVEDITSYVNHNPNNMPSWHSGLDEFCQYLRNILLDYQVENNKIVHPSQQVSRALVDAVQLMSTPNTTRSNCAARKLENYAQIIAKYGTREQQELFGKALKNFQHDDVNFFLPLIHNFEKHSHHFAAYQLSSEY